MNIIYDAKSIESLKDIIDGIKTYDNPITGPDGPIKWASIVEYMAELAINGMVGHKVLEIGVGNSLLSIFLADMGYQVTSIDKFGINPKILEDPRIESKIVDVFEYLESIPDNSLDIVVDSCAAIHFNPSLYDDGDHTDFRIMNSGCIKLSKLLSQKLKKGGKFITVTDFALSKSDSEFMTQSNLEDCYEQHLKLIGPYPIRPEHPFYFMYGDLELGIIRLIFQK